MLLVGGGPWPGEWASDDLPGGRPGGLYVLSAGRARICGRVARRVLRSAVGGDERQKGIDRDGTASPAWRMSLAVSSGAIVGRSRDGDPGSFGVMVPCGGAQLRGCPSSRLRIALVQVLAKRSCARTTQHPTSTRPIASRNSTSRLAHEARDRAGFQVHRQRSPRTVHRSPGALMVVPGGVPAQGTHCGAPRLSSSECDRACVEVRGIEPLA